MAVDISSIVSGFCSCKVYKMKNNKLLCHLVLRHNACWLGNAQGYPGMALCKNTPDKNNISGW